MNAEEAAKLEVGFKPPPPTYILDMIHDAMRDLAVARRILKQKNSTERRKASTLQPTKRNKRKET